MVKESSAGWLGGDDCVTAVARWCQFRGVGVCVTGWALQRGDCVCLQRRLCLCPLVWVWKQGGEP